MGSELSSNANLVDRIDQMRTSVWLHDDASTSGYRLVGMASIDNRGWMREIALEEARAR